MTSTTALAAPAVDQSSAAALQGSVAPALYRAALGPVNVDHYLAAFERLDAMGRVLPGWNMAAALCSLGWLGFRRLWRQALWVAAALIAGGLLLWVVGRQWLAVPLPMLAGLALAGLMVLCGGLGLYGDALVHAEVRRRIVGAVSAASTLRDAKESLQRQACSRRRLLWVVALSVALVLAAVLAWLALEHGPAAQRTQDVAKAQPVLLPKPEPDTAPRPVSVSGDTPAAPSAEAEPPERALAPVDQPQAEPPTPEARPEPVRDLVQEPPSAQAQAQPRTATPVSEQAPHKAAQRRLYINVGLFADPENARRTHARLRQAGLPCSVEPVTRADGSRLQRVRVGPFGSAAQANAAVAKVRAMGLEAVAAAQ
ncbi:MAG: SPOR domain-containing protein [Proteobacteria bacterium]|nr:SPOR domain-containing protein [Pseudomonadota bacterium]